MRLPRRSAGAAIPESVRTMMLVWKNLRMVKTGIATTRVAPREAAMISDDIDISDTSNSAKRSCRQNISEGCTMVGTSVIPCGATRPSSSGRVRSLSESAMLSCRWESVMRRCRPRESGGPCGRLRLSLEYGSPLARGRQSAALTSSESILRRHAHIDAVVAHANVDRPQAILGIAAVAAGFDVEFPAVPGADDVLALGETQPAAALVGSQFLLDTRDDLALADRAAVVRAVILIGEQAVALAKDAELEVVHAQHAVTALRELAELAHHDLVHRFTPLTLPLAACAPPSFVRRAAVPQL